jgi:hypothetical protein
MSLWEEYRFIHFCDEIWTTTLEIQQSPTDDALEDFTELFDTSSLSGEISHPYHV